MSVCLSAPLSLFLSLCLSLCGSVYLCLLSPSLSLFFCTCLSLSLTISVSRHLYLPVSLPFPLPLCLSVCLSLCVFLSVFLSVFQSVSLSLVKHVHDPFCLRYPSAPWWRPKPVTSLHIGHWSRKGSASPPVTYSPLPHSPPPPVIPTPHPHFRRPPSLPRLPFPTTASKMKLATRGWRGSWPGSCDGLSSTPFGQRPLR